MGSPFQPNMLLWDFRNVDFWVDTWKNHEVIPKGLLPIMKQANLSEFFSSFRLQAFLLSAKSLHIAVSQW